MALIESGDEIMPSSPGSRGLHLHGRVSVEEYDTVLRSVAIADRRLVTVELKL
jgi:hypothetical protein